MREFILKHRRILSCAAFAVCVLAAILVPVLHAQKYCSVRDHGTVLKFRCKSHDPYTPFLGRYLTVRLSPTSYTVAGTVKSEERTYHQSVYVKFRAGSDGFAEIESCSLTKPADMTGVWLIHTVFVDSIKEKGGEEKTHFNWWRYPVDRYYLNETLAQTADRLHIEQKDMVAYVSLKDGAGIIKSLTIKGEDAAVYLQKAVDAKAKGASK